MVNASPRRADIRNWCQRNHSQHSHRWIVPPEIRSEAPPCSKKAGPCPRIGSRDWVVHKLLGTARFWRFLKATFFFIGKFWPRKKQVRKSPSPRHFGHHGHIATCDLDPKDLFGLVPSQQRQFTLKTYQVAKVRHRLEGFHSHGGSPIAAWFIRENPILKWMMTGGTRQETTILEAECLAINDWHG